MIIHSLISTSVLLLALAACTGAPIVKPDPAREEAAIRATDARWLASAQAHDLEQTVSYWTDDVYMMPPGGPPLVGKDALRQYVAGAFATPASRSVGSRITCGWRSRATSRTRSAPTRSG